MILEKLSAIQIELNAPKGQRNDFGKYNYRSAEDILMAVKPLLKEHGCALTLNDDIRCIEGRFYVLATATLFDLETKESIKTDGFAREEESKKGMDASQVTGACSSYARKYALNGLFCIDDNKDADTNEFHNQTEAKQEAPKAEAAKKQEAPKAEKPMNLECSCCHKPITDFTDKNGKVVSAKKVADKSFAKFGKIMCVECAAKAQAAIL